MSHSGLKFLADECCDAGLVAHLRADGYDVSYQVETSPGAEDDVVLENAYDQRRIILTEDKDFGELVFRLAKPSVGIILLRIEVRERDIKWPRLKRLIEGHGAHLPGHFIVVERDKFRIRPLMFKV